ncbi:MAG TPA: hypothetical protein VHL52_03170 [Acidimicrobiia bacterium]|nr:hypothetical protein [Acidimicrobiia bacterium]
MTTGSLGSNESTFTVFRRAVTAEWTRLWTLRSTWYSLLAAAGLMLFVGGAAGIGHTGTDPAPIWEPAQIAIVPGQFAFLLVVLLAVTGEYSTGAIRSTLQWVPRRGILLVARTLVPVAFVTVCAVVVSAATGLVAWAFVGESAEVVAGDIVTSLGRIGLVVAFGGLLTAGIALTLRSTAGTLTVIFLLMFVLVVALGNSGVSWLTAISEHLPGRAIVVIVADQGALSTKTIATVMVGWSAAALSAGGWSLIRRDAT